MPPEQWPLARALGGETVLGAEVEVLRGDAGPVPMLVASAPVRDPFGEVAGAVVALQDVSALREVDRLKDEFVSVVSHELRTPLTSIRGSLQLVLEDQGSVPDAEHLHLLQVALNNCERLIRIINDILDVSKIEAGKTMLRLRPSRADDLVAQAIENVDAIAAASGVAFSVHVEPGLPLVLADPDRMVQVLVNLLSNAVKFTPNDSIVVVEAKRAGDMVAVSVVDHGVGMSAESLARVFQKFQQVDSSTSRAKGGTGLGLAIVKGLVEQHGGAIAVESAPEAGTRFTFTIPIAGTAAPEPAPGVPAAADGDGGPHRSSLVLVVDDDDDFRLVVRKQLERAGYRVVEARDGAAGLHVAREALPDVITMDLMMPGMNGWELLQQLTADPQLNEIPVIVVSAVADRAGTLARDVAVLAKPVGTEDLLREIASLVPRSKGGLVLIAEDDDDLRWVLTQALEGRGYQVVQARDGAEALALVEREPVNLILLDLKMPNVDGFAVMRRLQLSESTREIPVLVISGSEGTGRSEFRAMRLGATGYMAKPIDVTDLARRIQDLI